LATIAGHDALDGPLSRDGIALFVKAEGAAHDVEQALDLGLGKAGHEHVEKLVRDLGVGGVAEALEGEVVVRFPGHWRSPWS